MFDVEFHIAHELDNSANNFFYKPVSLKTNLLRVKILDAVCLKSDRRYIFYLNIDGVNFALIGRPLRRLSDNEWLFLIEDSRIELRRYPRLNTEHLDIKVQVDNLIGKLADISLGGCRVVFNNPISGLIDHQTASRKRLTFYLPDYSHVDVWARVVAVNPPKRSISFAFLGPHERVLKLYQYITDLLKRERAEGAH